MLPKTTFFRDSKSFGLKFFNDELNELLRAGKCIKFLWFQNSFLQILKFHACVIKKNQRFNSSFHIGKQLLKVIMLRSRSKKIFNKNCNSEKWSSLKKDHAVNLWRYFEKIKVNGVKDNKNVQKTIKTLFSKKDKPRQIKQIKNNIFICFC